jgi:glucose/arabinose dehydrogenase
MKHVKIQFRAVGACLLLFCASSFGEADPVVLYENYCASCHGDDLAGGGAKGFTDGLWRFGATKDRIFDSIKVGIPDQGMPAFGESLDDEEVTALTILLQDAEKKAGATPVNIPDRLLTLDYEIKVDVWVEDLEMPWAIDFTDEHTALITEQPGRLRVVRNGVLHPEPVANTPQVLPGGQGGLMDVAMDPAYEENGWIYLAYTHALPQENAGGRTRSMTRLSRGRLRDNTWSNEEVIYAAPHESYRTTRHHYGCRIVFDPEGRLYFAIGERGHGPDAQDLSLPNGKVHRIWPDGSIPKDNPFVNQPGALDTIFTYGNRNAQGLAVHPLTGRVWETEHGPKGGDELNLLSPGLNYGWPKVTYGIDYNGSIVSEFTHLEGMEQPILYWRPSIAACGLDFYRGDLFPKWKHRLLAGALAFEEVRLLNIEDERVMHQEIILKGAGRVRDVSTGPDGAIYVVLNRPNYVLRLSPIGERNYR